MSKTISELTPRNNINGNELIPVSIDGTNYCVKASDLSNISETLEIREAFTPEISFFQNGISPYLTNYENGKTAYNAVNLDTGELLHLEPNEEIIITTAELIIK